MEKFNIDGIECKIISLGRYYQVFTEFKDRIFAELFDIDKNSIRDVKKKFKILFEASRRRLRKRKQVLCEIWKKQGIHKEIPNF